MIVVVKKIIKIIVNNAIMLNSEFYFQQRLLNVFVNLDIMMMVQMKNAKNAIIPGKFR